jgi:hypothetical protein
MGQERLQQNVFAGVLPSSYLFIDDGSLSARWQYSINNAPGALTVNEFDAGYYGKHLRFTMAAGVMGGQDMLSRFFIPTPSLQRAIGGFIFRVNFPDVIANEPPQVGDIWPDPTWDTNCFDIKFGFPALGSASAKSLIFRLDFKTLDTGAPPFPIVSYDTRISVSGDVGATWSIIKTIQTNFFSWPGGGFNNAGQVPWCSVRFYIEDGSLIYVDVNGVKTVTAILLANWPFLSGEVGHVTIDPFGISTLAKAFDLDQLWISDTENIV